MKTQRLLLAFLISFVSEISFAATCTPTSTALTAGAGYTVIQLYNTNTGPQVPSIAAIPGNGGTVQVQYSLSPACFTNPSSANWGNWPAGVVTSYTSDSLIGAAGCVRAQAVTANGTLEICQ